MADEHELRIAGGNVIWKRLPVMVLALTVVLSVSLIAVTLRPGSARAAGVAYNTGDVFAVVGNGNINYFSPSGVLLDTLVSPPPLQGFNDTGMAFDTSNNLYATDFDTHMVSKFDNTGNLLGPFDSGYNLHPESIVFDSLGNAYVGQADGSKQVLKFNSSSTLLASYSPAPESSGTDWIDLAANQCTLFYTSEGIQIKRFDVCTNTQLTDFNLVALPVPNAYALRILPDGGVLVVDTRNVVRLNAAGNHVQTYTIAGESDLFALSLDSDGATFWTGGASQRQYLPGQHRRWNGHDNLSRGCQYRCSLHDVGRSSRLP